ncbi:MAG: AlpA family phage regulatory protein [Gloeomargaritaceae cyanobacterium C42_A2020_066]|nr:AlpA family phage regulatory protein [Gloeomargaritaceae cyanobacterium C42_A2020_066]
MERLLKLDEVLQAFPVSRSTWYAVVKEGRYPKPVKLGHRTVAWRESAIRSLICQGVEPADFDDTKASPEARGCPATVQPAGEFAPRLQALLAPPGQ